MNISSVGTSAAQVAQAVSLKAVKETNDATRQQGDAAISLLEQAAELSKSLGADGGVDVVA